MPETGLRSSSRSSPVIPSEKHLNIDYVFFSVASESKCEAIIEHFKEAIKAIIKSHYGDVIKIDFNSFTICVEDRCAKYNTYEAMLLALVIVNHFTKKVKDAVSNPSEKSLNTSKFQ
jgi:RNase P/RNase MRP subunit POP5